MGARKPHSRDVRVARTRPRMPCDVGPCPTHAETAAPGANKRAVLRGAGQIQYQVKAAAQTNKMRSLRGANIETGSQGNGVCRRLSVRANKIPGGRAEGPFQRLLLSHVPEGVRRPFMAFVRFPANQVDWSTSPDVFARSNLVERGFCRNCGTPLSYPQLGGPQIRHPLHTLL